MKQLPITPDAPKLLGEKMKSFSPQQLSAIFSIRVDLPGGIYPHYEKVKRLPPPEGLTAEEHWLGIAAARLAASRSVSLFQKDGAPFWFTEPSCVRANLSQLDKRAAGSIATNGHEVNSSEQERYFARSLIEEPFSSSVLEGAATTRQIAKKMIEEDRQPRTKDERMVLNNYLAMRYVKRVSTQPLTPELIKEIHRIVCEGTMENPEKCGNFRSSTDNVAVYDDLSNEVLHFPPPAEELQYRIESLCRFCNEDSTNENFVHPLIKAIILHFMIGYDHPFVDGNGRTARALFYWYAVKSGYWLMEYISISKTIMKAPAQYGKAYLHTESDRGDLTYFIIHQLNVMIESFNDLFIYMERRKQKIDAFVAAIADKSLNHRQSFILNEAARNRMRSTTISAHQKSHGVSYLTARKDLEELSEAGYFQKRKRGRENVYLAAPNLLERLTKPIAPRATESSL
ncbi:MAG: Fic family protein [Oceanicaulis sp.]|nr:Fic family protein [Oceanicaulis sp.]